MRRATSLVVLTTLVGLLELVATPASAAVAHWVNDDAAVGAGTSCASPGFNTIQAAVTAAAAGDTIHVCAGTYTEDVAVNKTLSLLGAGIDSTIVSGPSGGGASTIAVQAANVLIDGFTITRDGNTVATWNDPLNSAGVSVQGQTSSMELRNSLMTGNRTGVDINNSNGNSVHNNVIDFNRTGMIFRNQTDNTVVQENGITNNWTVGIVFLDASGGSNVPVQTAANSPFANNDISGNWYGQIVDRQSGGSLPAPGTNLKDFSGNWWGASAPITSTANSAEPGYASQIPVEYGGTATPPGGQPDILGPASANFDFTPWLHGGSDTNGAETGFQGDLSSLHVDDGSAQVGSTERIQEGVNLVTAGGTVDVETGNYDDANPIAISKTLDLTGPNAGISPNDASTPLIPNAARGSEATIGVTGGTRAITIGAPNVIVDGFRFTDTTVAQANVQEPIIGAGVNFGGSAPGVVVRNNTFDEIQRIAVYFNNPTPMDGGTIEDNRVDDPTRPDSGCGTAPDLAPSNCGRQLFNPWKTDNLVFQRNVTNATPGNNDRVRTLNVNDSTGVLIADNTIRHTCTFTCMAIAGASADVTVQDNDVLSQGGNAFQLHSSWSTGSVTVDHNLFGVGNDYSVVVDNTSADLSQVHVNRNSLGDKAVRNGSGTTPGTETLDADCNWYGSDSGPDTSAAPAGDFFGPVDSVPFLVSADLDGLCSSIPSLTADESTVTVNEGTQAANSGTYAAGTAEDVAITASVGTVTKTGTNTGTWSWTYTPDDGPADSVTITITGDNTEPTNGTVQFPLAVQNVAPTGTFSAPSSLQAGDGFNLSIGGASDPSGPDTSAGLTYAFDCGTGYGAFGASSSQGCVGLSPGSFSLRGKVRDKDGGESEYANTVQVTPQAAVAGVVVKDKKKKCKDFKSKKKRKKCRKKKKENKDKGPFEGFEPALILEERGTRRTHG